MQGNNFHVDIINRAAEGGRGSRTAFGFFFFSFVCDYIQTSADDVIISQL